MIFDLKINGQRKADGISTVSPVFSWECGTERQFIVQMSSSPKFQSAVMYLDTRNCYCIYDGSTAGRKNLLLAGTKRGR